MGILNGFSNHIHNPMEKLILNSRKDSIFLLILFLILPSQLVSGASNNDGVFITQSSFQALKAIKHDLLDIKGILQSWNISSTTGVCSGWIGIKCVNGNVIAIQLPWKGLAGKISDKVGQLQSLRRISLHNNALTGPIPASLGFLPNLRGVYLFNNLLSGSIPPSIGQCHILQSLDLSNNQLGGTIPPSLMNSTRLYRLNLSYNSISGQIPAILSLSDSLTFLSLQHNNLSGSIPTTWGSGTSYNSSQLKSLTLNHNFLSGDIPTSLSKLGNLKEIDLSHNLMSGAIPNELGNLSSLQLLDLSQNYFTGRIPSSIANLQKLSSFSVSYNNLSDSVPSFLLERFNSSSFVGNIQLCGYSVSTPCPAPAPGPQIFIPSPLNGNSRIQDDRKLSTKDIILIASGAFLIVLLLLLCCLLLCCLIRRKSKSKSTSGKSSTVSKPVPSKETDYESGSGHTSGKLVHFDSPFVFTTDDLLCATAEIMGKSSYGTSYKATLEDENHVAVKRLREKLTKGHKEFETEAAVLGQIRHANVLAMRAYYLGPKGEKLLVFDYMSNGSLASFLHARGPETAISWEIRMNVIVGITKGLCYLHNVENMVHGNLTSSNVLLDEKNNPTIADVGLSRLMTSAANNNVIATAGTQGYRAPELLKIKNANPKTDVYSLGVIMLELLTGKSPSEETDGFDLPQWVASVVKEEWTNEVFDLELMRDPSSVGDELLNTLKLALHCVDPDPTARPEAREVLEKLEEIKPEVVAAGGGIEEAPAKIE